MLKSSLCDCRISLDKDILVKEKITITGVGDNAAARQADKRDTGVSFKNCAPFTNCISEINNTQIDNAKDIDIVMPMNNLIDYIDYFGKTSGRLWQYYRNEPNDNLTDSESMYKYLKTFVEGGFIYISSWKSKGLSNEKISSTTTSNYNQAPQLVYDNPRIKLSFDTDLLKQDKVTCNHGPIVNIYIVYRLAPGINNSSVTLKKLSIWCS